jgi:hypothetical protein
MGALGLLVKHLLLTVSSPRFTTMKGGDAHWISSRMEVAHWRRRHMKYTGSAVMSMANTTQMYLRREV